METQASTSIEGLLNAPRLKWGWLLALGIGMILLGTIALGDTLAVTLVSVVLIGWLLLVAGILHVIHLIRNKEARTFWRILGVVCDFVAGFYLVTHPALGALTLTLVIAAFLLVSGITRLVGVFERNLPNKFWPTVDGLLSIVLAIMLWRHWPWSGLWFIGFALAIGLIFRGWAWVMIALSLRRQPSAPLQTAAQPA
jgi:uncharacterized membrane protein HdeD (DUF308 family)